MDFQGFKEQVSKEFKLSLNDYKETQLKRRINNLVTRSTARDYKEYLKLLKEDKDTFVEFMDYITINVSEFFRNPPMFKVLEERILPDIVNKSSRLKIWSAACSNGSEPYSMAMILADIAPKKMYNMIATDLDENILKRAQDGLYTKEELKNISSNRVERYFKKSADRFAIDHALKSKIRFKKHDLLLDSYEKDFDLIVCRNVTIYFNKEAQEKIYKQFHQALKPGGYLFIGGTENIFNHKSIGFDKVATCFYQKTV